MLRMKVTSLSRFESIVAKGESAQCFQVVCCRFIKVHLHVDKGKMFLSRQCHMHLYMNFISVCGLMSLAFWKQNTLNPSPLVQTIFKGSEESIHIYNLKKEIDKFLFLSLTASFQWRFKLLSITSSYFMNILYSFTESAYFHVVWWIKRDMWK